jgi:molybdenum cofactor cytidylyltransferase
MTRHDDITAFILAAGYSSRMEKFKPLLPLGPVTVLERSAHMFSDAGIHDIRVVIGHRAEDLKPLLQRLRIRWVVNERFQDGMLSSVQAGVRTLESSKRAFFLLPVDIPLVRRSTVIDLLQAHDEQDADVLYPCFLGKRGHPPLINAALRSGVLSWNEEGGLRSFLQKYQSRAVDVEVADEHVLLDMDHPREYEDMCLRLPHYDIPSIQECMVILTKKFSVSGELLAHSIKVAQVAVHFAQALNAADCGINIRLVAAAALLHDLAKGKRNHASVAARILTEMGYPAVAKVVGAHMAIGVLNEESIGERDVVCLADRVVHGDQVVKLEERYRKKLDACSGDGPACEAIALRLAESLNLKRKLEGRLGNTIESLLATPTKDNHVRQSLDLLAETR